MTHGRRHNTARLIWYSDGQHDLVRRSGASARKSEGFDFVPRESAEREECRQRDERACGTLQHRLIVLPPEFRTLNNRLQGSPHGAVAEMVPKEDKSPSLVGGYRWRAIEWVQQ